MPEILKPFILSFIPIFVAVDALGNIPLFIGLTEGLNSVQRRKIISESVVTAAALAIIFMFIGKFILRMMGITVADFKIAGGILLLVISVHLLLPGKSKLYNSREPGEDIGVFPLGTPLITGPAVLATTLIMLDSFGLAATFVSLILNMALAYVTLYYADILMRLMGEGGSKAFSKIADIILAAIAVMMIRQGIMGVFLR